MNETTTPKQVTDKANEENKLSMEIFESMRTKFLENLPEEEREAYQKFGEKFHSSFDVNTGSSVNLSEINMEEALAYVVQGLESGLHPKYITEDEDALLTAAYGEEWFKKWNYETKTEL